MIKNKKAARAAASVGYSVFRFALLIAIGYIVIYPVIYMISWTARTRKTEALFAHFIGIFCIFFLKSLDYMVVFMYNGYKRFSFILA